MQPKRAESLEPSPNQWNPVVNQQDTAVQEQVKRPWNTVVPERKAFITKFPARRLVGNCGY